jgi:hypothetical protein
MKFLSYLLCGLFIILAAVCSKEPEYERCDCSVQYFEENPEGSGAFILEKEIREERICGDSGDTLCLSPSTRQYIYDCR